MTARERPRVLLAEDDEDDVYLLKEALARQGWKGELETVGDGEQLLAALRERPRPDLILLDLNMPRMDGRQALAQIKADPELRVIPIVILTTSCADVDVLGCYRSGANSYVLKSTEFEQLLECIALLGKYWFETVVLPSSRAR